jgi:dihydrofolate reductase
MELVSVAAVAENGVIGRDGGLPWASIPADRAQYRARVAGHPVVVGRRTFESMRDDPPGTAQVVLSRTARDDPLETVTCVTGVDAALDALDALDADRAHVVGGAAVYESFQPHVTQLVLSRVPGQYEGTATFPDWDRDAWAVRERTAFDDFTLERWVRRE